MILVRPSFEILYCAGDAEKLIELAGRTCYKSEHKITETSHIAFIDKIVKSKHLSVLEHSMMSVKFVIDRGVSHELVRHRIVSVSQESSRYCSYKNSVVFIIPPWIGGIAEEEHFTCENLSLHIPSEIRIWLTSMCAAEQAYKDLLNEGWSPQQARAVLPNSLKTEVVMSANFREWQHIFTLRCDKAAHPQMREIMIPLNNKCSEMFPTIFKVHND